MRWRRDHTRDRTGPQRGRTPQSPAASPAAAEPLPRPPPPAPRHRRPQPAPARRSPGADRRGTAAGNRSRRGEPRTYDFRRPTKLSREHVRVLQIAQEAFARQATTILTTFLRAGARLELVGIEQFSYDDYVVTLPNPVFISTFTPRAAGRQGPAGLPAGHRHGHRRPHARRLRQRRPAQPADDGDGDHHHQPPARPAARRVRRLVRARSPRSSRRCTASSTTRSWPRRPSGSDTVMVADVLDGGRQPRGRGHAGPAVLLVRPGAEQRRLAAAVGDGAGASASAPPRR